MRDVIAERAGLWIAFAVATAVVGLPYGYVVGLVAGTLIAWGVKKGWVTTPSISAASDSAARPTRAEQYRE